MTNTFVVQLLEQVHCNNLENIKDILWDREKYWRSQLFTIAKGMNSILDLYSSKRKGYRKREFITFHNNPHLIYPIMSLNFKLLHVLTENLIDILIVVNKSCK